MAMRQQIMVYPGGSPYGQTVEPSLSAQVTGQPSMRITPTQRLQETTTPNVLTGMGVAGTLMGGGLVSKLVRGGLLLGGALIANPGTDVSDALSGALSGISGGSQTTAAPSAGTGSKQGTGGGSMTMGMQGYGISGPGVPEPAPGTVMKQWSTAVHSNTYGTFRMYYFQMWDGWTICYNPSTQSWKKYRTKHRNVILSSRKPNLRQAIRAQKFLDRLWKAAAKGNPHLKTA